MDLGVLSSLVLALSCVTQLPAVSAEYCTSYWGVDGYHYDVQQCGFHYCCGNCNYKHCCPDGTLRLSQEEQRLCPDRPTHGEKNNKAEFLGKTLGSVFSFLVVCGSILICCVCPCCLLYKCCKKRRRKRQTVVNTTTVFNAPQQLPEPFGQPQSYPGGPYPAFQLLPLQSGYGAEPMPPTPPSYLEATIPGSSPVLPPNNQMALAQGQPVYPSLSEYVQPPYNPSYCDDPNPKTG